MAAELRGFALIVALVCGAAGVARAGDGTAGKAAFLDGERLFKLGRFDQAIDAYERAFSLDARPAFLFNIALAHRRQYESDHDLAHLKRARELYRNFLLLEANTSKRAGVEQLIDTLTARIHDAEPPRPSPPVIEARPLPPAPAPVPAVQPAPAPSTLGLAVVAPAPPPRKRPSQAKWWIIGAVGAVVLAGAAVAIGVAVDRSSAPSTPTVDLMGMPR